MAYDIILPVFAGFEHRPAVYVMGQQLLSDEVAFLYFVSVYQLPSPAVFSAQRLCLAELLQRKDARPCHGHSSGRH